MAFLQLQFHSDALMVQVSVNVILPERASTMIGMDAKGESTFKTLYLLHGLSDDHSIWMRRTAIERYASEYNIAVVMPAVGRSWYTDTVGGEKYLTFVTEELPDKCRSFFKGMSERPEDNIIAGLSMGGYGAIKSALTHPDRFGMCASLSGSLDITALERIGLLPEWRCIFDHNMQSPKELAGTEHDLFYLADKQKEQGMPFPKTFIWCGTDDWLLDSNNRFSAHLNALGVAHEYRTSEGNHSWKWWDMHIQSALAYLLG